MPKGKSATARVRSQIQAYFASLPPKARAALRRIRATVRAVAPGAEEAFSYGIPAFKLRGRTLVWYAAFTNHCSLYPMTGPIRRKLAAELDAYETAKGTVRLPLAKAMPVGLIKKLVKARISGLSRS